MFRCEPQVGLLVITHCQLPLHTCTNKWAGQTSKKWTYTHYTECVDLMWVIITTVGGETPPSVWHGHVYQVALHWQMTYHTPLMGRQQFTPSVAGVEWNLLPSPYSVGCVNTALQDTVDNFRLSVSTIRDPQLFNKKEFKNTSKTIFF